MAKEYDSQVGQSREVPEDLEHKEAVARVEPHGYKPSPIAPAYRTGSDLTDAERAQSLKVPGTLMQSDGSGADAPDSGTTSDTGGTTTTSGTG